MFKVAEIFLFSGNKNYIVPINDKIYLFGANSSGKTALWYIIDYVLGSSSSNIYSYDGLDNIDSLGAKLIETNTNTVLYVKRDIVNQYYIKKDEKSDYILVSDYTYKNEITQMLGNINPKFVEIYEKIFDEKITYRAFSFINLLSEKGLGDLSTVFTEAKEIKHQLRIRDIVSLLFNFENIEDIYYKKIKLENIENEFAKLSATKNKYEYNLQLIKIYFQKLGLKYSDDMSKNNQTFSDFKFRFFRKENSPKEDIVYLQKASLSLAEEIKTYGFLKQQTHFLSDRNNKLNYILSSLKAIVDANPLYSDYVKAIESTIKLQGNNNEIISSVDYEKAINQIYEEKIKIDDKINKLKMLSVSIPYEETIKLIGIIDHSLNELTQNVDFNKIDILSKERDDIKKAIKSKQQAIPESNINHFNNYLTEIYKSSGLTGKFAVEDKSIEGLNIIFSPLTVSVSANKLNSKNEITGYVPGSMSRQTVWQVLTYLSMFHYLKDKFQGLPYLPILLIDAIDQPFEEDQNIDDLYSLIKNKGKEIGIQIVIFSKCDSHVFDDNEKNDITKSEAKGLNPYHKTE